MSYVLDALRRAEADRQRGRVPDLHAPAAVPLAADAVPAPMPGTRRRWWIVATAAMAVAAVAAAWWWAADAPRAEPEPPQAVTRPSPPPKTDAIAAAPVPVPPPVALPSPTPPRSAARRTARPDVGDEVAVPAGLPTLVFGGAFDSPDPKARMLIINGQLWREGDEPAPGLVLARISLHSAQFRFRGRTVEMAYDGRPQAPSRP